MNIEHLSRLSEISLASYGTLVAGNRDKRVARNPDVANRVSGAG